MGSALGGIGVVSGIRTGGSHVSGSRVSGICVSGIRVSGMSSHTTDCRTGFAGHVRDSACAVCVCVFDSVCVFGSKHGTSKWLAALRRASCGLPTHRLRYRRQATRRLQQVVDFLRDKHDQVCSSASTRLRLEGECDSPHPARFAPRLGSPLPHLHRDCWAGFRGISLTEAIQWTVRALHRTARAIPSRCAPSPGASVAGGAQCRCGGGEPIPGAAEMWQRCTRLICLCSCPSAAGSR